MSFLSSIITPITSAAIDYQKRISDQWARKIASTLPQNVQYIFNQVAKDRLVRGFTDKSSFYEKSQTSDVSVLKTKNEIS